MDTGRYPAIEETLTNNFKKTSCGYWALSSNWRDINNWIELRVLRRFNEITPSFEIRTSVCMTKQTNEYVTTKRRYLLTPNTGIGTLTLLKPDLLINVHLIRKWALIFFTTFEGLCIDGINTFTCQCKAGYSGRLCSNNQDDCNPNPCQVGNCTDGVNDYNVSHSNCNHFDSLINSHYYNWHLGYTHKIDMKI